jgi:hypothetical protein
VKTPAAFAGYAGWDAVLIPVTYDTPWAAPVLLDPITDGIPAGTDWTTLTGSFVPPANVWLGVAVQLFPTGPAWDDLPAAPVTAVAQRTNRTLNPRAIAAGAAGWLATRGFGIGGAGAYSYLTGATPEPVPGLSTARRKTWTTANTQDSGFIFQNDAATYIPVTPGERITVSAYVRHTSGSNKPFRLRMLWHATSAMGSAYLGPTEGPDVTIGGGSAWTRLSFTGTVIAGAGGLELLIDVMPGTANWTVGNTADATGVLVELNQVPNPVPDSYFDGDLTDVAGSQQFDWTGAVGASTSTQKAFGVAWDDLPPAVSWDSLGAFDIDDVLLTAPSEGLTRLGMVFSGRITDLEAQYDTDQQATRVEVTAADQRAELGNRDVGDYPWPEEPLGVRFGRIVQRSGQPVETRVSASAAAYLVSWRDVDRQPAMVLLDELATSADGVLWAATHPTTGPYLELESMSDRVSLFVLQKTTPGDGLIRIVLKPTDQTGAVEIDACQILLDPVRWRHDIEDVATRVAVTWREQTVDDEGQQKPTDRTENLENPNLEAQIGVRRIALATQLSRQADAQNIAGAVLGRTGISQWRISGLEWHVNENDDQFDGDALTVLMKLLDGTSRNGLPIILTNLPTWSPIAGTDRVPLFLEGGRYTSQDGAWELDLIVSSATTVGDSVLWDELPPNPGWSWNDFAPEVRWIDMGGVSAPR